MTIEVIILVQTLTSVNRGDRAYKVARWPLGREPEKIFFFSCLFPSSSLVFSFSAEGIAKIKEKAKTRGTGET